MRPGIDRHQRIGCYTLRSTSPSALDTWYAWGLYCMALGMERRAFHTVVAVIGDSTFLHSGITASLT